MDGAGLRAFRLTDLNGHRVDDDQVIVILLLD